MKSMNKKILVSLSVLATPFVVESFTDNTAHANGQYTLNTDTKTYKTASSAVAGKSAASMYTKGNYYVYKQANGMINISKTPGKPGAWINPKTNTVVAPKSTPTTVTKAVTQSPAKTTTAPTTVVTTQSQTKTMQPTVVTQTRPQTVGKTNTYVLNNDVKAYGNAVAARTQKGSKTTYKSGNYFIFKEVNGMMNISKVSGRAGAWINPAENKAIIAKNPSAATPQKTTEIKPVQTEKTVSVSNIQKNQPTEVNTVRETKNTLSPGSTYILNSKTNVYSNTTDASKLINSRTTYNQGTYYVYKLHNGMINISRIRGKAGAWVNPAENKVSVPNPVNVEKKTEQVKEPVKFVEGTAYSLNNKVNTYSNALDASKKINSKSTYEAGYYTIYKEYKGMINITKNVGKVGVWINPAENTEKNPDKNKFTGYKNNVFYAFDKIANGWHEDGNGKAFFNNGVKYTGFAKDATGLKYFNNGQYSNDVKTTNNLSVSKWGTATANNFQYKNLISKSNYTAEELNKVISTYAKPGSKLLNKGHVFKKAEELYGVNSLYLLSHAAIESAWGTSKISKDKNNFFGIAAYDNSPYQSATGFDGVDQGILDGAKWITDRYLISTSFPASGPYLGNKTEGMNKYYATDAAWGHSIAKVMANANALLGNKDK